MCSYTPQMSLRQSQVQVEEAEIVPVQSVAFSALHQPETKGSAQGTLELKQLLHWDLVHRWLLKDFWQSPVPSVCCPQCLCQIPIWSTKCCLQQPPSLFQVDTIFFPTSFPKVKLSSQACVAPKWGEWEPQMLIRPSSQHSAAVQDYPALLNPCYIPHGEETPECTRLCSGIIHYKTSMWTFWWVLAIAENIPCC